jgi:hypothetical protein
LKKGLSLGSYSQKGQAAFMKSKHKEVIELLRNSLGFTVAASVLAAIEISQKQFDLNPALTIEYGTMIKDYLACEEDHGK